jgi:hypothetical protein
MIRILEWNSGYETADTRKTAKAIPWIRMNVMLADMRWAELWLERNAAEVWAGWTALIFCAAQSEERGTIESVRKVSILSRVPEKMVQSALEWALQNGMAESDEAFRKPSGDFPEDTPTTLRNVTGRDDTKRDVTRRDELSAIESVYQAYPKKVGKAEAIKAIAKALKSASFDTLLEATSAYAEAVSRWPEADKVYIPHPATWFNARRWEDDRATWVKTNGAKQTNLTRTFDKSYYEEGA